MRVVLCTCPADEAKLLAHQLVEERLIACANILPGVTSVYRWEGAVCEDNETLLVMKTSAERILELTERIRALHSYEVPEVIALPLVPDEGNPAYLSWLLEQVG